jgi:hypothetical protein
MCRFAKTTASSRAPSQNETHPSRAYALKSFRITAYINEIRTQRRPQARGYSKLACSKEADSNKQGDSKAGNSHSHNCSSHADSSHNCSSHADSSRSCSSHADSSRSCSTRDDGVCRPPGQGLPTMRMLKQPRASSEDMISSSYGSSYNFPCHENDTRVSVRAQGVFFTSVIKPFGPD